MERHFDVELDGLKEHIRNMGELTSEAIFRSIESLKNRDAELARSVIERDIEIDRLELAIDDTCIDLIARYQPMARDLRFITTGMKVNMELERIADIAVDIAQRTLELVDKPLLKPLVDIPKLAALAQNMVCLSIDSFLKGDAELARRVVLMEPESDALRNAIQRELVEDYMLTDASAAPRAVQLLLIARFLERICDHTTNIAENVFYMARGEVVRHRPERLQGGS